MPTRREVGLSSGAIEAEFENADLGDARRTRRLQQIAHACAANPAASFPKATLTSAALEGTYRFLSNPAISDQLILESHFECTRARAEQVSEPILVVHDTTVCTMSGESEREDLGPVRSKSGARGFFAHVALALAPGEERNALGVIGLATHTRGATSKEKCSTGVRRADSNNESRRWATLVDESADHLGDEVACIHVMDREADNFPLFAHLVRNEHRFVIRLAHDRALTTRIGEKKSHVRVSHAMERAESVLERTVPLGKRPSPLQPKAKRIHSHREARVAKLEVRAERLELKDTGATRATSLMLGVVEVREVEPPEGQAPVRWTLVTNESLEQPEDVARVVDAYRSRWTIEEFFRALKSGCSFERRQLESLHALKNALAIFLPIAWRLLLMRSLARAGSTEPANVALTDAQIAVLSLRSGRSWKTMPTITEAVAAIAQLGGHIRNNGPPGWIVLGRGFDDLLLLEIGWLARDAEL